MLDNSNADKVKTRQEILADSKKKIKTKNKTQKKPPKPAA